MEREIIFKAQRKSYKYWLYGDLIKKGSRRFIGYEIEKSVEDYGVENSAGAPGWKTEYVYIEAEVIPETVGQKIGQLHYSGDKIPFFEGDITEDIYGENRGVVMFEYDQWVVKTDTRNVNIGSCSDWVYLGSIHTHPELLTTVK